MAITMEVSASAISAWPQTMPPCRHRRSEKAMRRIAPGCHSAVAPGGGEHSMLPIDSPRSCTHGANTLPRTRLASSISNSSVCGSYCMKIGSSTRIGVDGYSKEHWAERLASRDLKMPDLGPYDKGVGSRSTMFRRWVLIFSVVAMGLALNGCTKCGPIWDDWMQSPKSCKSDHF